MVRSPTSAGDGGTADQGRTPTTLPEALGEGELKLDSALLSEQVYQLLRQRIISGKLAPGDRIVESELARLLSVSQAPVREAVKRLVHEGLVTHIRRQGSYVTKVSEEEAAQAKEVRTVLEELAAWRLAETLTEETVEALRAEVTGMRNAAATREWASFRSHDAAFHRLVCEASGNSLLVRVWDMIEQSLTNLGVLSDPLYPGDWSEMADRHARLIEVLRSGDPEKAAAAFARHFQDADPPWAAGFATRRRGRPH